MFEKIMLNQNLMRIAVWLLDHQNKSYNAWIIAESSGVEDPETFIACIVVLEEIGFISVSVIDEEDSLKVRVNKEASVTLGFETIRNNIDRQSNNPKFVQALMKLDDEINYDYIIDTIKNYKNIGEDSISNMIIKSKLSRLDDEGRLEDFIKFVERMK